MPQASLIQNEQNRFLTTGQAGLACGVTFRTVLRWIKKGYLKAHRTPGGDHRIDRADFEIFLETRFPSRREKAAAKQGRSLKILIVENDLDCAKGIQRALSSAHFETNITQNAFEAGVEIVRFTPDVITLDLNMPTLDGFYVLEQLKTFQRRPKVLVVTGADDARARRALDLGADAVLCKPFGEAELLSTLKPLLPSSHKEV